MTTSTFELPASPIVLNAGDLMPEYSFGPVSRTDIVRYAGAGGDFNIIHHDDEFARAAGLPSVFAMGLLQGGVVAQRLARWVGPHNVSRLRMRFTGQVWPGDVVTITGVVKAVDRGTATCEVTAVTQAGATVLNVEAVVRRAE